MPDHRRCSSVLLLALLLAPVAATAQVEALPEIGRASILPGGVSPASEATPEVVDRDRQSPGKQILGSDTDRRIRVVERDREVANAQEQLTALFTTPFDPRSVIVFDLTHDTSTAAAIRNSPTLRNRSPVLTEANLRELGRKIRLSTRVLIVIGHIEGTDFVTGDTHQKIEIRKFIDVAKSRHLHPILLGCNSATAVREGTGLVGKFNSVDVVGRLTRAMEAPSWGEFFGRLTDPDLTLVLRSQEVTELHDFAVRDATSQAEIGRVIFQPAHTAVEEPARPSERSHWKGVLAMGLLITSVAAWMVIYTSPSTRERRIGAWLDLADRCSIVAIPIAGGMVCAAISDIVAIVKPTGDVALEFLAGMMATAPLARLGMRRLLGLLLIVVLFLFLAGNIVYGLLLHMLGI